MNTQTLEETRLSDPNLNGDGWVFATLEHGIDTHPGAIEAKDKSGASCVYVPLHDLQVCRAQLSEAKRIGNNHLEMWRGQRRDAATHKCKVCHALWIEYPPNPNTVEPLRAGSWSLASEKCGPCCDNVPMGEQIEMLPHTWFAQNARLRAALGRMVKDEYGEHMCDNDGRGCAACELAQRTLDGAE